jgi:hypothetical protein
MDGERALKLVNAPLQRMALRAPPPQLSKWISALAPTRIVSVSSRATLFVSQRVDRGGTVGGVGGVLSPPPPPPPPQATSKAARPSTPHVRRAIPSLQNRLPAYDARLLCRTPSA